MFNKRVSHWKREENCRLEKRTGLVLFILCPSFSLGKWGKGRFQMLTVVSDSALPSLDYAVSCSREFSSACHGPSLMRQYPSRGLTVDVGVSSL